MEVVNTLQSEAVCNVSSSSTPKVKGEGEKQSGIPFHHFPSWAMWDEEGNAWIRRKRREPHAVSMSVGLAIAAATVPARRPATTLRPMSGKYARPLKSQSNLSASIATSCTTEGVCTCSSCASIRYLVSTQQHFDRFI
eukprot:6143379-Pleurochrysis_carterae.AAC.1